MKLARDLGTLIQKLKAPEFAILEASPDCITLLDTNGFILYINGTAAQAYAHTGSEPRVGTLWGARLSDSVKKPAQEALKIALGGGVSNFLLPARDGRCWDVKIAPVRDAFQNVTNLVVMSRDVTRQQQAEQKILWDASHDSLTALANRSAFQKHLDLAVAEPAANFGLLLVDVDHFKRTNDAHGHDAGDAVLCAIAERLKEATGATNVIARLGGDEFAVLLKGVRTENELEVAVVSIRSSLRAPCSFGGADLECGASIGGSLYPAHGSTKKQLLKNADVALYSAKAAGRGNFKMFRPQMLFELERHQAMLSVAHDTLNQDLIVPFYQPKVDLASGLIIGFEALLRWHHRTKGIQAPATLSAAFLDGVLAPRLSERIISSVIADMKMWRDEGVDVGHVALNAAAPDFAKGDFADHLLERLHRASLPFSSVQIEVTETVFLGRGAESVELALRALSAAGVRIALDDFGTGYASLSHLTDFPIDIIKIDRSFVSGMERKPGNLTIVEAVVALGSSLGICVVAEGVETVTQHAALEAMGCPVGQGFLYGKAGPSSYVAAALNAAQNSAEKRRFMVPRTADRVLRFKAAAA